MGRGMEYDPTLRDAARRRRLRPSSLSRWKAQHLRRTARVTPWYDDDELVRVGRDLLSASGSFPTNGRSSGKGGEGGWTVEGGGGQTTNDDDEDEDKRLGDALDRVALWRGRVGAGGGGGGGGASLPHAVEATASLAGALYADRRRRRLLVDRTTSTSYHLRHAYSSAIIRSVNGLADSCRRSNNNTASMSVMHCCSIVAGMPSWMVDVRHDASHSSLPSLCVCRIAAIEGLNFWRGRYWDGLHSKSSSWTSEEGRGGGGGGGTTRENGIRAIASAALIGYREAAMAELVVAEGRKTTIDVNDRRRQQQQQQQQKTQKSQDEERNSNVPKTVTASAAIVAAMKVEREDEDERSDGEDHGGFITNNRRGGGAIPWWILNDDDDKRKKKKKKKTTTTMKGKKEDVMKVEGGGEENNGDVKDGKTTSAMVDSSDEKIGGNNASTGSSATAGTISSAPTGRKNVKEGGTSPPPHPTPLTSSSSSSSLSVSDLASEFVKTTPIDVAYSTALRFLVWGRPTRGRTSPSPRGDVAHDEDDDGPALLILPPDDPTSCRLGPDRISTSTLERVSYDLSFERLRAMYDPLLIALTSAYPGFLPALFVHMVDSILFLEGARRDGERARVSRDGRRRHRRSEDDGGYEGGGEDGTAVELYDAGDHSDKHVGTLDLTRLEHHVQYMSRWVRYVLSRAFHMHFDKSVASWSIPEDGGEDVGLVVPLDQHHSVEPSLPRAQQERLSRLSSPCESSGEPASSGETKLPQNQQQQQRQPIDLKKRGRKKWTVAQDLYMQGPLDFSYLYEIVGMPLNSVCDRLLLFRQQHEDYLSATMPCPGGGSKIDGCSTLLASSSSSNTTQITTTATSTVVGQLHEYLENVIGKKERVIFMGIYDGIKDHRVMGMKGQRSSEITQMPTNVDNDGITKEEKKETGEKEEESIDGEESSPRPAKMRKILSLEEMEAIFEGDDHAMTDVDNGAPPLSTHSQNGCNSDHSTGERINHDSAVHIKPWTLCKGWDACAIGTLPGYPS